MYDIHTHVVPLDLPSFDDDVRWPRMVPVGGDGANLVVDGATTRTVDSRCWDMERRLRDMDADGIDVQVLSPLPDLLAYWAAPEPATAWCAWMNRWLADAVAQRPDRFVGLGIVAAQDVDDAVEQLDDVSALGLRGVELGTDLGGVRISSSAAEPLLRRAGELDLLVFIHSNDSSLSRAESSAVAKAAGYPLDIGAAVADLIARTVPERCPGLRLVASHAAGVAPLALHRLEHVWNCDGEMRSTLGPSPRQALRRVGCDSISFDLGALRYAVEVQGSRAVMVGSDYPFHDGRPTSLLEQLELSADVWSRITHENAAALFGLGAESVR